ncbi:MAG TPA: NlpC/P60 family protein [Gemmatimonadaceae bacterium]|nr:NlpC/P60 family protein [Gemmatimonadaceae bacterium]
MTENGARLSVPGRATIRSPIAPMYLEPFVRSTQVSQRLNGHEVEVLDEQEEWYRVRGGDGYEGWIHWGFLSPAPSRGSRQSATFTRVSLGCTTATADGGRRALPLGARLSPGETVKSGEAIAESELPARFPRDARAIVRSAQTLFEGAPYLWGGITPWGADCSGFVQTVFGLHGVALPRDAWQQSESGDKAGSLEQLDAADLAFFSDRDDKRVTHVAIAMGEGRLVHLALGRGGFATENTRDPNDPYVAKLRERFLRARRVLL